MRSQVLSQNLTHSQIEKSDSLFQGLVQVVQSQEPKLFPSQLNLTQSIGSYLSVEVMCRNIPELSKMIERRKEKPPIVQEKRVVEVPSREEASGVVLLDPVKQQSTTNGLGRPFHTADGEHHGKAHEEEASQEGPTILPGVDSCSPF